MKTSLLPLVGLILFNVHFSCQQFNFNRLPLRGEGSGSGSEVEVTTAPRGNKPVVIEASGSGAEPVVTPRTSSSTTIITDDEDEEDIIFNSSGGGSERSTTTSVAGSGNGEIEGSGMMVKTEVVTAAPTTPVKFESEQMICENMYCWCKDSSNNKIQSTLTFIDSSPALNCSIYHTTTTSTTKAPTTTSTTARPVEDTTVVVVVDSEAPSGGNVVGDSETTTLKRMDVTTKKPASLPPYVINTGENQDITPKFNPATPKNPTLDGSGNSDGRKGDDDVEREPAGALFTHPGILAIIIGGGIVALLSALLLIMFIVYRMRKKDEGSYPLDANSKPTSFQNTYSNTNKEFYL